MLAINKCSVLIEKKQIITDFTFSFLPKKTYVIMGPNGSGKSTLAHTIMGNPTYIVFPSTKIILDKRNITSFSADKRSQLGIALTFQSPLPLTGITLFQLMRIARKKEDVLQIKKKIDTFAQELKLNPDLLERPLHEGASGGERKKLEALQIVLLRPRYVFFDEIDTGVDIDSLAHILTFLKNHQHNTTYIFITHYKRILSYIAPEQVLIIQKGALTYSGGAEVIELVEKKGYKSIG